MIQPKAIDQILHEAYEHFDPDGNSLGFLNEIQNLDLRVQINEAQASGYYLVSDGVEFPITKNGKFELSCYLYSAIDNLLDGLIQ